MADFILQVAIKFVHKSSVKEFRKVSIRRMKSQQKAKIYIFQTTFLSYAFSTEVFFVRFEISYFLLASKTNFLSREPA